MHRNRAHVRLQRATTAATLAGILMIGSSALAQPAPANKAAGANTDSLPHCLSNDVTLCDAPDLATAISRHAWVAGCESMALVLALAAGRRTLCTLPPWAPRCRLPQRGLIHLS